MPKPVAKRCVDIGLRGLRVGVGETGPRRGYDPPRGRRRPVGPRGRCGSERIHSIAIGGVTPKR